MNNNQQAFFELLRAGLWEKEARLSQFGNIDYAAIMRLAEEQSLVGFITAGLEHVQDVKVPQADVLQFIGSAMQIEQRNKALNNFLAVLLRNLKTEGISCALVKGQGVAQCYERPLWRSSGDIDLLLDNDNYYKASDYLSAKADEVKENRADIMHVEMSFGIWVVELHGTLHGEWSKKVDRLIDEIQSETFKDGNFREWNVSGTSVLLPSPDADVIFVFTHILQHFFWGGIGLRQICDWIRLLWTYKYTIDIDLLWKRIESMGLMSEWKAFAALAVNWLGMPMEAMPFYNDSFHYSRMAQWIVLLLLEYGNFGHNRDNRYKEQHSFLVRLIISFYRHVANFLKQFRIFPVDSLKVMKRVIKQGVKFALSGYKIH